MEENKNLNHEEFDPITQDKFVPHHAFEGIKELTNEPPYWLSFIVIILVIFAYTYFAKYYIFKAGDLQEEQYRKEMTLHSPEEETSDLAALRPKSEEAAIIALLDETSLQSGKSIYKTNCAVCHLAEGQGLVGPNLTDDYWIHGGSFKDLVKVITNGVPAKGMISWKTQISKQQILEVASYLETLKGTNPPNPKEAQGELYASEE